MYILSYFQAITIKLVDMPGCIADASGNNLEAAKKAIIYVLDDVHLLFNYFEQLNIVPSPSELEDVDPYWENLELVADVCLVELPEEMSRQIINHNLRCIAKFQAEAAELKERRQAKISQTA